jgi:hypothetical protein
MIVPTRDDKAFELLEAELELRTGVPGVVREVVPHPQG